MELDGQRAVWCGLIGLTVELVERPDASTLVGIVGSSAVEVLVVLVVGFLRGGR